MTKRWVNVGAPVAIMMVFLWMVTFREEKLLLKKDVLLHPVLRTGNALLNKGEHIKGEVHCNALVAHSSGHWKHDYAQVKYNHSSDFHQNQTSINYFPEELDWIQGRNVPNTFDRSMCGVYPTLAMMYISQNGNQCGCGVKEFRPSVSRWVRNETFINSSTSSNDHAHAHQRAPAGLRLVHRLGKSNTKLCFVGDSIDKQFYDALRNNLQRVLQLQEGAQFPYPSDLFLDGIVQSETTVNVTRNEEGYVYNLPPWAEMESVKDTEVFFKHNNISAKFSYFQFYGWAPWYVEYLEDCNVITMNLGLHYSPDGYGHRYGHQLIDDVRAAITTLVNFTSTKKNRVAVWRSALPQHFDVPDGHYNDNNQKLTQENATCVPIKGSYKIQAYNKIYDTAFADMCHQQNNTNACSSFEHFCTADIKETKYQTVYKFGLENLLPLWIDNRESTVKNGTVLRWNIGDLFDNPLWHASGGDCSHYCYVPELYDAAFERLDLLLPTHMKS